MLRFQEKTEHKSTFSKKLQKLSGFLYDKNDIIDH